MPAWSVTVTPDRPLALPDAVGLAGRLGPTAVLTVGSRGTTAVDAELEAGDLDRLLVQVRELCAGARLLAVHARPLEGAATPG